MAKNSAFELTVLTTLGVSATKTYKKKGERIEVEGYGRAKTFKAETIQIGRDGRWLKELGKRKNSFVVLGQPVGWKPGEKKRRLSAARDESEATLIDVPRALMPIDVDNIDFEPLAEIDDGEMFALELLQRLGLKGVSCAWHLTSGHGFFGRYRARLWVELSEPATAAQMKEYARDRWGDDKVEIEGKAKNLVDFSVYQPQQPIYTADPILEDGIESPVRRRVGYIEGDALKMKLPKKSSAGKKKGAPDDENVALLEEHGLYIKRLKPGQHCIRCPWEELHTGAERDDDTFYFEPHYNGHDIPAYKCHHDSCSEKKWEDVLEQLGAETESHDEEGQRAPNWVFVYRLKSFWDARDGALIDRDMYDATHASARGGKKPSDRFLAMKRSEKADALDFLPGQDRFIMRGKIRVLNSYIDKRLDPDDDVDTTPWEEHLAWMIPSAVDREHLADWLAWCYQNPGRKITWGPILYGPPGTGKTSVFNCLAECIGRSYVSEPTQAELEDKFNDWAFGKLLVKIEELMSGDKYHVAEKLKPVVANATLSIRRMHQTGFSVTNVANVCASTNHMRALPIEKGDRRWMIVQCTEADSKERSRHMRRFHRWLEETGYGGIAAWFAQRDLSGFVPTREAPDTELKRQIVISSMTDLEKAIDVCAALDQYDMVTSTMVDAWLERHQIRLSENSYGLIAYRRKWVILEDRKGRVRVGDRRVTIWPTAGNRMRFEAFLSKKPQERARLHENMVARLTYSENPGRKDG